MEGSFTQWRDSSSYPHRDKSVVISDSDEDVANSSREIDKRVVIDESYEDNDDDVSEDTTPKK